MNEDFFDPDPSKPSTGRGPGRPPRQKTADELKKESELSVLFEECEQAYTIKVYRNEPEWCSGYLGYFKKGARRGLTMDEIKNRFGGREFQLIVFYSGARGIQKQKTIIIEDAPRREGLILNRDGTTQPPPGSEMYGKNTPLEQVAAMNLPVHLQKQLASYFMGIPEEAAPMPAQQYAPGPLQDMFMQKTMLDMMNQQSQSQMQMMREQYEMHQRMMRDRRESETEEKKNPMGDMENIIRMIRELNGIKTELGGSSDQPLASQILENVMPFAESMMTEYWGAKKLALQNQLAIRSATAPPPKLPPRPASGQPQSPVSQAREMARMYRGLSPEDRQDVMRAFISEADEEEEYDDTDEMADSIAETYNDEVANIRVASTPAYDIVVSDADRQILEKRHDNNGTGTGDISDGLNSPTAEADDTADRAGDPEGIVIPADTPPGGPGDVDM